MLGCLREVADPRIWPPRFASVRFDRWASGTVPSQWWLSRPLVGGSGYLRHGIASVRRGGLEGRADKGEREKMVPCVATTF